MANPTWPGSLPSYVLQAGYQEQMPDQVVESDMETGPPKVRRRFTTAFRPMQWTIRMDAAQRATFETFYLTTCAAGATPFDWVHPYTQAVSTFRFRKPPPTYTVIGGMYVDVQMNVWMMA